MNTRIVELARQTQYEEQVNFVICAVLSREELFKKSSETCLVNIISVTLFRLLSHTHTHTHRERERERIYIYIYDGFLRVCLFFMR